MYAYTALPNTLLVFFFKGPGWGKIIETSAKRAMVSDSVLQMPGN